MEFIIQPTIEFDSSSPPPVPENTSEDFARIFTANVIDHAAIYASSAKHMLLIASLKTGKTIGACNFYIKPDASTCELWGVFVDEACRRNGVAKALLLRAVSEAAARGARDFSIRWADPKALYVDPLKKAVFDYMAITLPGARITYEAGWSWVYPGKGS